MEYDTERTRKMAYAAVLAALTGAGAILSVPIGPVPVTFQVFFVLLAGYLLGPRWGATAIVLYLLLGAAGLPVYAGGTAGVGHLVGPTGGYLVSFPIAAALTGLVARLGAGRGGLARLGFKTVGAAAGYTVIYTLGVAQLMNFYGMGVSQAVAVGVLPFLATVPIEGGLAVAASESLNRAGITSASAGPELRGNEERAFYGSLLAVGLGMSAFIPWSYASAESGGTTFTGSLAGTFSGGETVLTATVDGSTVTHAVTAPSLVVYGAAALAFGGVAFVIALASASGRLDEKYAGLLYGVLGVASAGVSVASYYVISSWTLGGSFSPGYGVYLPAIMGVGFVVLGVYVVTSRGEAGLISAPA